MQQSLLPNQALYTLCEGSDDRTAITDSLEGWYGNTIVSLRSQDVKHGLKPTAKHAINFRVCPKYLNESETAWVRSSLAWAETLTYKSHYVCFGNIWPAIFPFNNISDLHLTIYVNKYQCHLLLLPVRRCEMKIHKQNPEKWTIKLWPWNTPAHSKQ